MSRQDEQILDVMLDLMSKKSEMISQKSMKKIERSLRPILMRRQKNAPQKPKEISKHMYWRPER